MFNAVVHNKPAFRSAAAGSRLFLPGTQGVASDPEMADAAHRRPFLVGDQNPLLKGVRVTVRAVFLEERAAAVMAQVTLTPSVVFAMTNDILAVAVTTFEDSDDHDTASLNNTTETITKIISAPHNWDFSWPLLLPNLRGISK